MQITLNTTLAPISRRMLIGDTWNTSGWCGVKSIKRSKHPYPSNPYLTHIGLWRAGGDTHGVVDGHGAVRVRCDNVPTFRRRRALAPSNRRGEPPECLRPHRVRREPVPVTALWKGNSKRRFRTSSDCDRSDLQYTLFHQSSSADRRRPTPARRSP